MKKIIITILTIITLILLAPIVLAHSPIIAGKNTTPEKAIHIHKPTKSWAIYGETNQEKPHYYQLEMKKGQKIYFNLFTPNKKTNPKIALLKPKNQEKTNQNKELPNHIEIPENMTTITFEAQHSTEPDPEYEPFTPGTFYYLTNYETNAEQTGDYYIVVYGEEPNTKYGLAIGTRESFTFQEWIRIPIDTIRIHQWKGQSLVSIFFPMIIAILIIEYLLYDKELIPKSLARKLAILGGLLYIGSGFLVGWQMILGLMESGLTGTAIVTLIFVSLPILFGYYIIQTAIKKHIPRNRVKMVVLGILGIGVWAGLIVGPILVIITILIPEEYSLIGD